MLKITEAIIFKNFFSSIIPMGAIRYSCIIPMRALRYSCLILLVPTYILPAKRLKSIYPLQGYNNVISELKRFYV